MICPKCRHVMIVVEYKKIELDYCTNCFGVWFDAGELELMLGMAGLKNGVPSMATTLNSPEARTTEEKRRCPICSQRMRKTAIGQEPKVLIDVCPTGDGLWFDGGEINQLISTPLETQSATGKEVLAFLEDTFKARKQLSPKETIDG